MDKIVCLVGESGSGKSTIAEALEKEGYNYIQSYTDRPKRYDSERGHIYVNQFSEWLFENQCIEIIADTYFDGHTYWTTREQYQGKGTSIYVIDSKGVEDLKDKVKDAEILVIYLKVDGLTRWKRMFQRELIANKCEKLDFIQRTELQIVIREKVDNRLKHDNESFKIIQCNYVVDGNRELEEVLMLVKNIITK